jgi:glycosyltransferase involved in cell wall biosynthesis
MTADAVGGVWTYCLAVGAELARAGAAVELAVMGPPPDQAQRQAAARIPGLSLHLGDFKLEWMDDAEDEVRRAGDWLLELDASLAPDVVHLNGYAHGCLPFGGPKVVVAHSCVVSWWRAIHGCRPPERYDWYTALLRIGLARANAVVAPSRAAACALEVDHGIPRNDVVVIANGLPSAPRPRASKQEFIFSAGRFWDPAKNLALLLAAAPALPWPVLVAGETSFAGNDQDPAPDQPVRFLGRLDAPTMAGFYARAAVFALPARYEPFGLSILEAALGGCALMLGDIDSLRENWDGAAAFVDPRDGDGLAAGLRDLIANRRLRDELGQRARRRASQLFAGAMGDSYLRLYEELINRHGAVRQRAATAAVASGAVAGVDA